MFTNFQLFQHFFSLFYRFLFGVCMFKNSFGNRKCSMQILFQDSVENAQNWMGTKFGDAAFFGIGAMKNWSNCVRFCQHFSTMKNSIFKCRKLQKWFFSPIINWIFPFTSRKWRNRRKNPSRCTWDRINWDKKTKKVDCVCASVFIGDVVPCVQLPRMNRKKNRKGIFFISVK